MEQIKRTKISEALQLKEFGKEIASVTLADEINDLATGEACDINGKSVIMSVKRV